MIDMLYTVPAVLIGEWLGRRKKRSDSYWQAAEHAAARGKPLLVIGDPQSGLTRGDYGYGDKCVDLSGCPCAPEGRGFKIDLSTETLPFEDDSHVIFSPFVLEYVDNVDHAYGEFCRVAGSPQDMRVLTLGDGEFASYAYPGARWLLRIDREGRMWKKCVRRSDCIKARASKR